MGQSIIPPDDRRGAAGGGEGGRPERPSKLCCGSSSPESCVSASGSATTPRMRRTSSRRRCWRRRGRSAGSGGTSLSTWLYTIARSFCIKKRRRSRHAPEVVSIESERRRGPGRCATRAGARAPPTITGCARPRGRHRGSRPGLPRGPPPARRGRPARGGRRPHRRPLRGRGQEPAPPRPGRGARAPGPGPGGRAEAHRGLPRHRSTPFPPPRGRRGSRHLRAHGATPRPMPAVPPGLPLAAPGLRLCQATPLPRVSPRLKASIRRGVKRLSTVR